MDIGSLPLDEVDDDTSQVIVDYLLELGPGPSTSGGGPVFASGSSRPRWSLRYESSGRMVFDGVRNILHPLASEVRRRGLSTEMKYDGPSLWTRWDLTLRPNPLEHETYHRLLHWAADRGLYYSEDDVRPSDVMPSLNPEEWYEHGEVTGISPKIIYRVGPLSILNCTSGGQAALRLFLSDPDAYASRVFVMNEEHYRARHAALPIPEEGGALVAREARARGNRRVREDDPLGLFNVHMYEWHYTENEWWAALAMARHRTSDRL